VRTPVTSGEDKLSILVVEDHPATRQFLALHLKKAGYQVTPAQSGLEALEILEEHFHPLIITDWMMPGMDGLELCRSLRQGEWEGYVYVILLTARDSQEDIIRGLEAGADDYLTKPVNPLELLARLKTGRRILELEHTLKQRNQEIARLSVTDPLTGCYNRRYLNETLPQEIKRAWRYHRHLGVIMCDLDHFKHINDTFGHAVGDLVLQEFAAVLKNSVRENIDWLSRYGGEEFVIVLPETDLAGSYTVAERLRRLVADQVMVASAGGIKVTASFGVAPLQPQGGNPRQAAEALLREADRFLYQAKNAGRNLVSGPPLPSEIPEVWTVHPLVRSA
jgi:two-component system cell cycle response regulator